MNVTSGESKISYSPYGEIIRADSSGPDIFRYKYSGQEEDYDTGLHYYRSRYYDPRIGRFLQADSVINTNSISGMNLYMYVDGNPVRYNDPSGKSGIADNFKNMVKDMTGGVKWAARNSSNTYKRVAEGKKYNDYTARGGGDLRMAGAKINEAGTFFRHMFSNTKNLWSAIWGVSDYVVSSVGNSLFRNGRNTWISYHNGGFVVHNSIGAEWYGVSHAGGLSGHLEYGESEAVMKHEVSHIHQSLHGGGWGNWEDPSYTTILEHDNDTRGFTTNYSGIYTIYRRILPDQYYKNILIMNAFYGDAIAGTMYYLIMDAENYKNEYGQSDPEEGLRIHYKLLDKLFILSEYTNSQRTFLFGLF